MRNEANHSKQHKCKVTCANMSHAYVRDRKVLRRARARDDKTEKIVRATRCCVFTPVVCTTFANVCTRNHLKKTLCGW